ncbi:hypothetical protein IWQ60_003389 [Tieghemiomyces parasiticus]|uniref:Uncharacterized protein n=1 Tax=Tieghemiomyces parasiticus TaxID=78921 RepID=A0A9W8AHY7_9FUNG|nr:hypothetical protein IWQ60_003389 [Tieghemiomyces parasiticus]
MSERDYQNALASNDTRVLTKIRSHMEKSLGSSWQPSVEASSYVNSVLDGWGHDEHGAVDNLPDVGTCQFVNLPYAAGFNSEPSSGATESSYMNIVGQNLATAAKACF